MNNDWVTLWGVRFWVRRKERGRFACHFTGSPGCSFSVARCTYGHFEHRHGQQPALITFGFVAKLWRRQDRSSNESRWAGFELRQGQRWRQVKFSCEAACALVPGCLAGMLVYCYAMRISISNLLAWVVCGRKTSNGLMAGSTRRYAA